MSSGKRLRVKKADSCFLIRAYREVENHNTSHFTIDHLSSIGISATKTGYHSDGIEPSFKPNFFKPISWEKLRDLLSEVTEFAEFPTFGLPGDFTDPLTTTHGLDLYFNNRLQQRAIEKELEPLVSYSSWVPKWIGDSGYRRLNNFTGIQDWRVVLIFGTNTPAKPHMMAIMMNQIKAEEGCLLQGELMAVIRLMHKRLPARYFQENLVFPVLIFSYTGIQHVRLVQGHVQDETLNIKFTKLYDLRTEKSDIIDLVLRYFLCDPVGDTRLDYIKG